MNDSTTARHLLKGQPISLVGAARLVLELVEEMGERFGGEEEFLRECRKVLRAGCEARRLAAQSVSVERAVDICLSAKRQRAKRTQDDIRYYMRRLLRCVPSLAQRSLRSLSPQDCAQALEQSFTTPTQLRKARMIFSGVFTVGAKRGLCGENPLRQVEPPAVREKTIEPLSVEESGRLLSVAKESWQGQCLPAVALMLYAGVRPQELTRLCWRHLDFDENEILLPAQHSKTGGGRHIALCPALRRLLLPLRPLDEVQPICPPNWQRRWRLLRRAAGFPRWVQDVLRHTYASFYVKQYRDLPSLQLYMGHRNLNLLYTRYVNLHGIAQQDAARFWAGLLQ